MKTALITGITGMDGAHLAELLLSKGYTVHGIRRRTSSFNTWRIDHLLHDRHEKGARLFLHYGDMTDATSLTRIIAQTQPDEIYNLAAQSHVAVSFEVPEYSADVDGIGALKLLEAVRTLGMQSVVRIYQASTSEIFGDSPPFQNEETSFRPRSPYAVAKLFAYWTARNYREAYGMHISNGIAFNHEGPLRGENFVTRKISRHVASVAWGNTEPLYIGNLEAKRDWGHAADYVEGMWLMLQQKTPGDYVLATGEAHTVREFCELAFQRIAVDLEWDESGAICALTKRRKIVVDPSYFRPTEVESLCGDASKAKRVLGWEAKTTFKALVHEMVEADKRRRDTRIDFAA